MGEGATGGERDLRSKVGEKAMCGREGERSKFVEMDIVGERAIRRRYREKRELVCGRERLEERERGLWGVGGGGTGR